MSSLFVKNIPSIKEREFKFRAKMSSEKLNDLQSEAFSDILDLFNKSNELQKIIYEMSLANNIESSCYTKRLEQSVKNMNLLAENYKNLTSLEKEYRYQTKYAFQAETIDDYYKATIDKNTNDIIAGITSSISKTRLYDSTYDETLVPSSLTAFIGPDSFKVSGNILSIEDSEINNAFDGKESTVWFRKVITTTDVSSIENEIVIGLPEDIVTTRLMNQITIKPFPVGFLDILDVKYKSNGAWQTIPGFKAHYGCSESEYADIFGSTYDYNVIENASNVKFNFQALQTNQIKIKFRQRNYDYDAENNRRIWYLGFRDIDVVYNVYTKDHSEFDMVYDFPEKEKTITIYDAPVYFNNVNVSDDKEFGVTKEYFYYDSDGNTHKISATCPFILTGHKLRVKYTIEGNQETPNIHMCKIKYKIS